MRSPLLKALILFVGIAFLPKDLPPRAAEDAAPFFPPGDFLPGWSRPSEPRAYRGEGLYDHIDGGAEAFLEMGFRVCWVQRYTGPGGVEAVLEQYLMADAEAALGIFLLQSGPQGADSTLPARSALGRSQGRAVRGDRYLVATLGHPFDGSRDVVRTLLGRALERIESAPDPSCLAWIPSEGMIPASLRLARGPLGLQALLPFAEEDLLALRKSGALAVGADYPADGGLRTLLVVSFPDEAGAQEGAATWRRSLGWPSDALSGRTPDGRIALLAFEKARMRVTLEPSPAR